MNYVFVFILPSVFGFKLIYNNVEKHDKLNLIIYECILLLITNLICSAFVLFKNSGEYSIVYNATNSTKFSVAYIIFSIFISLIVGLIITIFDKYLKINVEVKHEKNKSIKNYK